MTVALLTIKTLQDMRTHLAMVFRYKPIEQTEKKKENKK